MKKRFLILIVCICALCGAVISGADAVSQTNSLISKSYLENVYLPELQTMISEQVSAGISSAYNSASQRLNSLGQAYLDRLAPTDPEQVTWLTAADFLSQCGEKGDTITLAPGAGLIWTSGAAQAEGILIDLTDGAEVTGRLKENHRYIAPAEVLLTVTGETAYWSVEGEWRTTADGIEALKYPFTDVSKSAWYYESMKYVVDRGLFSGTSATTFAPNNGMSRSMLATVFYRMNGSPAVTYEPVFNDVPNGTWYTNGVLWFVQNGMTSGSGGGGFSPNRDLTRQETATLFYNYANWLGLDTSVRGDLSVFPDSGDVASWATDGLSWAVSIGLFKGNEHGALMPKGITSRAQVATLIQRFELWMTP